MFGFSTFPYEKAFMKVSMFSTKSHNYRLIVLSENAPKNGSVEVKIVQFKLIWSGGAERHLLSIRSFLGELHM